MQDESRNTIIFLVCAVALFLAYQFFVLEPQAKRHQAEAQHQAAIAQAQAVAATPPGGASAMHVPAATRQAALAASPRVPIATPSLKGSIALRGARIDDLFLTQYRETVDKNAPPVELLRPEGVPHAWFAEFGWTGQGVAGLPGYNTLWTLTQGSRLAPGQPIVLTYSNGAGLTFTRKIEVDDKFMFTVTETVTNSGAAPVTLAPYATIQRDGPPEHPANSSIVHEGAVGATGLDKTTLTLIDYKDLTKKGGSGELPSKGGWLGITDKYWLAALIPSQAERITGQFTHTNSSGTDLFDANEVGLPRAVAPGQSVSETTRLFAGAKVVPLLRAYESQLGIPRFDDAVDWGRYFFWLTHPIFWLLEHIEQYVGAFGLSILVLTVVVRGLFFPLANKSYESMTKMKKVQPLMDEIRKRYADDPAKQQQEMMALYSREKVNPLAGCVPILFQIPVFYSLYKVLTVTIEMRQASFLWIHDLSARDPTTMWNLFGLIPWNPAHLPLLGGLLDAQLHIGLLPIVYGLSMWLSTAMNPPAPDPTQQRIFQLMPIFFTFIMAPFAVGLLIYWTWSNILSILQQYVIMRRFKVDNPIDRIIRRIRGRTAATG